MSAAQLLITSIGNYLNALPPAPRPVIALSANSCWNLIHFRRALLDRLQDAGYELVAFAPLDKHAEALRERGIELYDVPIARSGLNPARDLRLIAKYISLMRQIRPAAYCSFTIKPNIYGAIAGRLLGVPVINNITGLGTTFLDRGLLWTFTRALYRFALSHAHTVFFHNEDDLRLFARAGIVSRDQGRVIPGSGVDLERYAPLPGDRVPISPPIFLFIGRFLRDKGIHEFATAARQVRRHFPHARFLLIGSADAGNRSSVSAEVLASWRADGAIEDLGEQSDVRPFIRDAMAVVLPSYREGLSRALLEAAAMGRPLVGTDVPGVRELVVEGVTGALAQPRDARSLADAMVRIATLSPAALAVLGANARRKVEQDYGEAVVVDAYRDALHSLAICPPSAVVGGDGPE